MSSDILSLDFAKLLKKALSIFGASFLLWLLFLQAGLSSPLTSPSFDEPYDLARGYAYARTTDLRMQQEHPVLIDGLGGLMLRLMPELTPPDQIPGWEEAHLFQFSQALLWDMGHDVDKMVFLARFPVISLALILGAVVYRWAADMYGVSGGLLALALIVFNPNIVAHGRILSTDLGATCLATFALYLWWRWARHPTGGRLAATALVLGLALAAKTSNLLLVPLIGVLTVIRSVEGRWRWPRAVVAWGAMAIGGLFVLWALYRFEFRPAPQLTGACPVPAASYWEAAAWVRHEMQLGRPAFLWGRYTIWGWWYYFPFAFLIKTPLPLLILLGLAVWLHGTRRVSGEGADYALWIFPPLYFGLSAFSTLNLGYRHILPTLPLITIYAARAVTWSGLRCKGGRWVLLALLGWLTIAALAIFPHHLAYFNELVGGPANGYRYLVDSNLDWGQGLKHLRRYLKEEGIDDIWLGYFGTADPAYYLSGAGVRYRSLFAPGSPYPAEGFAPINPTPGWYAISATVLQGVFSPEPDLFDWFRRHEPVAKVGYSIFVYQVEPESDPPTWLAFCYAPEPALEDAEITHRFGRSDLRMIHFDCTQTWVYPADTGPGWVLVPIASDGAGSLAEQVLEDAEVVYRERGLREAVGYTVYRWHDEPVESILPTPAGGGRRPPLSLPLVSEAWSSSVLAPVEGSDPLTALSMPVNFEGQAVFLGYHLSRDLTRSHLTSATVRPGDELVLTTAWRVVARPQHPPLSIFAHLIGPAGAVSVGDGLGFPAIQWLPGDIFIQCNRLSIPPETSSGSYWVQVGLYSLATGERLLALDGGEPIGDRILLESLEVVR